jgi:hypothetical protein
MNKEIKFLDLVNKTVVENNYIYKVIKVSSLYVYVKKYNLIKSLSLNDDCRIYKAFSNVILNDEVIKLQAKIFKYKIIDENRIENIYLVNNKVRENYQDSMFFKDETLLSSMYEFYYLFKNESKNGILEFTEDYDEIKLKILLDETTKYFLNKINYFEEYIKIKRSLFKDSLIGNYIHYNTVHILDHIKCMHHKRDYYECMTKIIFNNHCLKKVYKIKLRPVFCCPIMWKILEDKNKEKFEKDNII